MGGKTPGSWSKGKSGNPSGRPVDSEEAKEIKKLTKAQLLEMAGKVMDMSRADLEALKKDPAAPALKVMIAGLAIGIMDKGDSHAFQVLMDRLLGKVSDKVRHEGIPNIPASQVVVMLPSNGREKVMKKIGEG
jgi:hypothetical protein